MAIHRFTRRQIVSWGLIASGAALVAACGQGAPTNSLSGMGAPIASGVPQAGNSANPPTTVDPPTTVPPTTHSPATTPLPATPQQPVQRAPECKAANLALHVGHGAGGAAGSSYPALEFTNTGATACQMVGFPGVSFANAADGQVGVPALRTGDLGTPVLLLPGDIASALLKVPNTDNYPASDCRPVPVKGFGVYPPDDDTEMFASLDSPDATACSNTSMQGSQQQLFVQSMKEGTGIQ